MERSIVTAVKAFLHLPAQIRYEQQGLLSKPVLTASKLPLVLFSSQALKLTS